MYKYDVLLHSREENRRLGQFLELDKARELAEDFFRNDSAVWMDDFLLVSDAGDKEVEIVKADGKGYGWKVVVGDKIIVSNLTYSEAKREFSIIVASNFGAFLDVEKSKFIIREPKERYGIIVKMCRDE